MAREHVGMIEMPVATLAAEYVHRRDYEEILAALKAVVETYGPWHDEGCPCDDTCDCSAKPIHDAVNAAIRRAEGE